MGCVQDACGAGQQQSAQPPPSRSLHFPAERQMDSSQASAHPSAGREQYSGFCLCGVCICAVRQQSVQGEHLRPCRHRQLLFSPLDRAI